MSRLSPRRLPRFLPTVSQLEDRSTPAIITVTTLADTVAVDGAVSLREAIQSINAGANINADVTASNYGSFNDNIGFTFGLSGTISLASDLDAITKRVVVQGNLTGAAGSNPTITVDGGLQFKTFVITGPSVTIARLAIVRSSSNGILITGAGATGAIVRENRIGIDADGTTVARNAESGVAVAGGATGATIGGIAGQDGNVLSGNTGSRVLLTGSGTSNNAVVGNIIGLDATGTLDRSSAVGVIVSGSASNNTIGGITPDARNVISGNSTGITINKDASGNAVQGNYIGSNASGTAGVRNGTGILIASGATGNTIGGTAVGAANLIAFNSSQGVAIQTGFGSSHPQGNQVLGNSIHSNGGLGIDLGAAGVTANDNLDADTGPNQLQNYPVITSVVGNQIFGSVHSRPGVTLRLEFFSSTARDASGFGEGETYLGSTSVTPEPNGNATFTFNAPSSLVSLFASATATPTLGGTSEFGNTVLGIPTPPLVGIPPLAVPNPIVAPPLQPVLVPQLIVTQGLPPLLVPSLLPSTTPQLVPLLVPPLRAPNPVLNTPITAPGVTPVVVAGDIAPTAGAGTALQPKAALVVGAGLNGHSIVVVYNADGSERGRLTAFPGFLGGVRLRTADVNHDGHADILAAAGVGGGPHVKVFSGVDGSEIRSFYAYDPSFTGGVWVAGGDVNGDGYAEVITGAGAGGGPHVKVFDGKSGAELASFFAYHLGFSGGVTVAAGDLNSDGLADVVTGAGPGGGPHVKVIEGTSLRQVNADGTVADDALLASFFAYDLRFFGGVFVTAGADLNSDGLADVVTGAGPGGGPHVKVIDTARVNQRNPDGGIADGALLASFYGYEEAFRGGVRVGEADALQDGVNEIILGAGPGGGSRVRVLRASGLAAAEDFFAFVPEYTGGVFVD